MSEGLQFELPFAEPLPPVLSPKQKHAAYMRQWAKKNPQKVAEIAAKSRLKNIERANAYSKRYLSDPDNKRKAVERARVWKLNNPERNKANQLKLAPKARIRAAAWKRANPDRVRENIVEYTHRRRARISSNGAVDVRCKPFVRVVKLISAYSCTYCQQWFSAIPEIDHRIPLSRGGPHSLENLTLSCPRCNQSKGAKTDVEYLAIIRSNNKSEAPRT